MRTRPRPSRQAALWYLKPGATSEGSARWRTRVAGGYLVALAACSGVPLPGEGPELFFTRCMAFLGYEVREVSSGPAVENCCGFTTDEFPTPNFDEAVIHCEQEVYDRYD